MTEAQAKEAISAAWVTAWAAAHPGVPTSLGNEAATPPAGASLFAALSFGPLVEKRLTMGTPARYEARGTVVVKLFGPTDAGEAGLAGDAGVVRDALASQTIAEIAGHGVIGEASTAVTAKAGSWWTNTVTVAFRYYDRR